jgi:hypothetical protein
MKKSRIFFAAMISLLLLLSPVGEFSYAMSENPEYALSENPDYALRAVSRINVLVDRTSSDKAIATISGSTNSVASSITMTATLYEYSSGKLTKVSGSSVTKKTTNCSNYNFDTSYKLSSGKSYKVTAVVVDVTNGVSTTTSKTSSVF